MRLLVSFFALVGVLALAAVAAAGIVIWTGAYDVAADSGHGIVDRIARTTRENSVASRDGDVNVPPLDNPFAIAAGAAHYDEMCTACHLAPGMANNEMRPGLNPEPAVLAKRKHPDPKEDFWIVKHGIKMTAMPAWGLTHSDQKLWSIVAFLQKLPGMSAAEYRALVQQGEPHRATAQSGAAKPVAMPLELTPDGKPAMSAPAHRR